MVSSSHHANKPTLTSIQKFSSIDEISSAMSHVFQDAQSNLSGHRKLVVVMRNIFDKAIELGLEENFAMIFTKLINKMLSLKKGEQVGDRIAKFCSSFVASLSKHELLRKQELEKDRVDEEDIDEDEEEDSFASLFIKYLIHHLLRGIEAKDKNVRYRVVQLLAYLVYYIGEIDHDTFEALFSSLNRRMLDKEATVRIQAVVAISRFQSFNFDFDEDENPFNIPISKDIITEKIIVSIKNDESAEVRRAALLNLSKNQTTIPHLVDRARDTNPINRRLVYSRISREMGDFKNFDFDIKENLLKWGLHDRDESVQKAAKKMLNTYWFEAVNEDILELIDYLKVTESKVADTAMYIFFETRPDKLSNIKIDEAYWKALTVEKAFLMRTFYYHCSKNNIYDLIESNFPESIDLAQTLEKYLQLRIKFLDNNDTIIKEYDIHEQRLEFLNSQLFTIENSLSRIKFEVDIYKKNFKETNGMVSDYETILTLIRKRVKKLDAGDEDTSVLIDDDNGHLVEQIVEFTTEELKRKVVEINDALDKSRRDLSKLEETVFESELKFKQGTDKYHVLLQERADEINRFSEATGKEYTPFEEELKELEFIIEQLLLVSKEFDFSDEIGRRKMLQIIRTTLTEDKLPPSLILIGLKVLRKISINEKDFITMATEIITDIRDSYENEDFHSAISGFEDDDADKEDEEEDDDDEEDLTTSTTGKSKKRKVEPKLPPDEIVIRCLITTQFALELIEEPLESHITLGSIYSGLVNYAINLNTKYTLHLQGLRCLGLFALIDKSTARDAISTFYAAMRNSGEEVRVIGMRAVVDILSTYGVSIMDARVLYQYGKLFYKALNSFEMPKLQCVVAEGLCKLFLADIFNDPITSSNEDGETPEFETEKQLFEAIILSYFHPLAQENQELRQILAFCIPVYAFSHPNHQFRLASVSGDCVYRMFNDSSELAQYDNVLSSATIIQQLIDWCNPNHLVNVTPEEIKSQTSHMWQSVYFLQVVEQDTPKLVKKAIINNLSKFYITEELDTKVLKGLLEGISGTWDCFEKNSGNSDFVFDKATIRNFENFELSMKELFDKSHEREQTAEANKSRHSRSNSILDESESTKDELLEDGYKSADEEMHTAIETSKENTRIDEDLVEDDVVDEVDMEEADVNDESHKGTDIAKDSNAITSPKKKSLKQQQIDASLEEIDQMLEEEDEVDYDISMADD
jgi:condensin complex subunit 3